MARAHTVNRHGSTTTVRRDGNRLVLVRHAIDPDDRARLSHAAALLTGHGVPGVETLIDLVTRRDTTVLVTAFVGERSLATHPPRTISARIAIVEELAATLRALHARGVTHGPINPTDVVLDATGRTVLCGFGDGESRGSSEDHVWAARCTDDRLDVAHLVADDPGLGDRRHPSRWFAERRLVRAIELLVADEVDPDIRVAQPGNDRHLADAAANRW